MLWFSLHDGVVVIVFMFHLIFSACSREKDSFYVVVQANSFSCVDSLVAFLIQNIWRYIRISSYLYSILDDPFGHTYSSVSPLCMSSFPHPLSFPFSPHLLLEYEHWIFLGTDGSLPQSVHHVQIIAICQGKQVEWIWSHPRARGVSKQFARTTFQSIHLPSSFRKKHKSFA